MALAPVTVSTVERVLCRMLLSPRLRVGEFAGNLNPEAASLARRTLGRYTAIHRLDQLLDVAVIGAGSVVTYQHATRPSPSQSTVVTRSPTTKRSTRAAIPLPVSSPQTPAAPAPTARPRPCA